MATDLRPQGRRFWVLDDMIPLDARGLPKPAFTVHETAKLFFGMSSSWLRLLMRPSDDFPMSRLVLDGKPIEIRRKYPEEDESARLFTLADIEPMAHSIHGFAVAAIEAERKRLAEAQPEETRALEERQRAIVAALPAKSRQRSRLSDAHAGQRERLAAKHRDQLSSLDAEEAQLLEQLEAIIGVVLKVARVYRILDQDGNPVPRG
jgi:hypothetical protein